MDNDESLFSSPKSVLGLIFFGGMSLYFIYWIYINIIKDESGNQNNNNRNIQHNYQNNNVNNRNNQGNDNYRIIKQKLSINMSLLMKDSTKTILMDINYLYELFDNAAEKLPSRACIFLKFLVI